MKKCTVTQLDDSIYRVDHDDLRSNGWARDFMEEPQ